MDISNLLQGAFGEQIINGAVSQLGIENQQAKSAVAMAVPFLLSALKKNAADPNGASGLNSALESKHDGSLLDNLGSVLGDGKLDMQDGMGILSHVLGAKQGNVAGAISKESGLSMDKVGGVLAMLAPILMSYIGKEKQQQGVGADGLSGLLGGMLGGVQKQQPDSMSAIEKLLDQDGDGSAIDDVMNIGSKLLGGFFK